MVVVCGKIYDKMCGKIEKMLDWNKHLCGSRYDHDDHDDRDKKTKKTKKTKKEKEQKDKKTKRQKDRDKMCRLILEQGGQQPLQF